MLVQKVLIQLLQPGCSGLTKLKEHVNQPTLRKGVLSPRYQAKACTHLVHYSVAGVLVHNEGREEEKEREREDQEAQAREEEKTEEKKRMKAKRVEVKMMEAEAK